MSPPFPAPSGTSWLSPFRNLQDGIDASNPGDTVKVAGGTYYADRDVTSGTGAPARILGDQTETFKVKAGVKVIGGFAGLALPSSPDTRNTNLYVSFLSGDINLPGIMTDNTDNIVTILDDAAFTELDGLFILYGHADANSPHIDGVGIRVEQDGATPTIKNCQIQDNTTLAGKGAGIFFKGTGANNAPGVTIENCGFNGNHAAMGAALACEVANPTVVDSAFTLNTSDSYGGAIYMWVHGNSEFGNGGGSFTNCLISGNSVIPMTPADGEPEGGRRGGGVYCLGRSGEENQCTPTFKNCQILMNSACFGGGIYCEHAQMNVIGCYLKWNSAVTWHEGSEPQGGGMYSFFAHYIYNSKFDSNGTYSIFQGFTPKGFGGGLFAVKQLPQVVNCAFYRNTSGKGGGMYGSPGGDGITPAAFTGINNTFSENQAVHEGGGYAGHISSTAGFINSIFWNNYSADSGVSVQDAQVFCTDCGIPPTVFVTHSCVQDDIPNDLSIPFDPTNIDADPMFRDPSVDNYRLKLCSPAIDIGSTPDVPEDSLNVDDDTLTTCIDCNTTGGERAPDLDKRTRVLNESSVTDGPRIDNHCEATCPWVVDMGAWEFVPMPCAIMGDVNANGVVNMKDYTQLTECIASGRFSGACACGDMDGNGTLDSADLSCLFDLITYGTSPCDGAVMCDTFFFAASNFGGSGEDPEASAEPVTWATLAATGVAESAAACLTQFSTLGSSDGEGIDVFTLALRWVAFEQWVTAHPVENFAGPAEAYDSWAKLQFRRIVLEGKMP